MRIVRRSMFVIFVLSTIAFFSYIHAQELPTNKDELRKFYQEKIQFLQTEIEGLRQKIDEEKSKEKATVGDLKNLDFTIRKLTLELERLNYDIAETADTIEEKKLEIEALNKNMALERQIIAGLLRNFYETQSRASLLKAFFLNVTFSRVFNNLSYIESLQEKIGARIENLRALKKTSEVKVEELRSKKDDLNDLKALNDSQKRELAYKKSNEERTLFEIREAQKAFSNTIQINQSDIDRIKQQLYVLDGLGVQMSFNDAYEYAKNAQSLTGVRAAFLLALLKKESQWGANIGKGNWQTDLYDCYVSLGKIERAKQEKDAFMAITAELGIDPNTVLVSKAPSYGCGGAMGPAQFLPSTWLQYKDQVSQITKKNPPSPFFFGDAIVAAALKLKELGATGSGKKAEWKAAQLYFAGSRWNNRKYYFYGDSIVELAQEYQGEIDILEGKK